METIFITGFDASLKTMIARLLASRKDVDFFDTHTFNYDEDITNMNRISSIKQGAIVSLDDRLIENDDDRHKIKSRGRVIYLRANADTIMTNLEKNKVNDNSVKNNYSIFTIEKLLKEKAPYYEDLSNYVIDVDDKTIKEVFCEALAIYHFVNKVKCHIYIK